MKRLFAVVVLYLLAAATAVFWARSYAVADEYPAVMHGSGVQIRSWHGRLFFQRVVLNGAFATDAPPGQFVVLAETQIEGARSPINPSLLTALQQASVTQNATVVTAPRIDVAPADGWNGFGFASAQVGAMSNDGSLVDFRTFVVPYWFVFAVLMVVARVLVHPILKRRSRMRAGRCVNCGYDLRESVDRCPECGTEFAATA